jgi:hypothetical protein
VHAYVEGAGNIDVPIDVRRRPPVLESISGPAAPGEFVTLTGSYLTDGIVIFPAEQGAPLRIVYGRETVHYVEDRRLAKQANCQPARGSSRCLYRARAS